MTFNWIDGTKEPGTAGRVLGTQNAMVSAADQNAQPDATIHAQGKTYVIAGKPADYAYEYRSGAMPVVDVYYTPEGYTPISLDEIFAAREKEKGAAAKSPEPAAPETEAEKVPVDVAASTVFGPTSGFRPVHRTGKGLLATCIKRNEEEDSKGDDDAGRE